MIQSYVALSNFTFFEISFAYCVLEIDINLIKKSKGTCVCELQIISFSEFFRYFKKSPISSEDLL